MAVIKSETWDGVTAPAIPSGWTVDSNLVTSTGSSPTSSPNSLVFPTAGVTGVDEPCATWATRDTAGGNVQVSSVFRWTNSGAGAGEQDVLLFARSATIASSATLGSLSAYLVAINRNSSQPGLVLIKRVAGTPTTLGQLGAAVFADATNYRLYLLCNGTQISARCQRLSDSLWLNSSGAWVADAQNQTVAISVTDTAVAPVAGYSGLAFYLANSAGGALASDDFVLETVPMPVPATVPGRAVNIGLAKQSAAGTPLSPSSSVGYWVRWLQGSKVRPDAAFKQEFEGDGNRGWSLNYKTRQNAMGKIICYPRPTEAAVLLQALSGSGSDALTAGTGLVGTSTAITGTGSQSFTVTATAGALTNVANGSQLTFDAGKPGAETVTLTAWNSTTGVGTATFLNVHTGTPSVGQPAVHTITPQNAGLPALYTLGQNTGSVAGNRLYQQAVDCLLNQVQLTASITSSPLKFDCDWLGLSNSQSTTPQTTALPLDGPFYWYSGTWTISPALLGGSTQNWSVAVKDLSLTFNNNVNVDDFMAEAITPGSLSFENLTIQGELTLLWQDGGLFAATYLGGGTADSPTIATGQLQFVFASSTDSQQTLTINLPNASLSLADIDPDLSGKPIEQKCSFVALRPSSGSLFTVTSLLSSTAGMAAL